MHPNAYLRTFWRTEFRPEVFVAMSFAGPYEARFRNVIEPAIGAVSNAGRRLTAKRVDLSRTGDSILTDIMDGVCHAELVLADVSTLGHDSKTGYPYRNGNVMYEVGLALACRQPSEVLLLRDDKDPFLFDVSTVPHKSIDFSDEPAARDVIRAALEERVAERRLLLDARVTLATTRLTALERQILESFSRYPPPNKFFLKKTTLFSQPAISRLLDKGLIVAAGIDASNNAVFQWTSLGYTIAANLGALMPRLATGTPPAEEGAVAEPGTDESDNGSV